MKLRIYSFALAVTGLALLAWWVYTLTYNAQNVFLSVVPPIVAVLVLGALPFVAHGRVTARGERAVFASLYLFAVGALLSGAVWPADAATRALDEPLVILLALAAYLLLPARSAVIASGALFLVAVVSASVALAHLNAPIEEWFAAGVAHATALAIIGLLYSLAWLRESWAAESTSRAQHQRLAFLDPLTELLNRRGVYRELQAQVAHGVVFSVVLADLDGFKAINDAFGHQVGDDVLRGAAGALRAASRDGDVVGRWGGEEFLLILPGTTLTDALAVAERLRERLERARLLPERDVTGSFGVAEWRAGDGYEELVGRADAGLYHAKRNGKNRVCAEVSGHAASEAPVEARRSSIS